MVLVRLVVAAAIASSSAAFKVFVEFLFWFFFVFGDLCYFLTWA